MKCKKCRKQIPDDSKFCNYCGAPQKKDKMYRRPDGLYEKVLTIDGKRVPFRAKTEKEVNRKIAEFQGIKERGPLFKEVAEEWKEEHFKKLEYNTQVGYEKPLSRAMDEFGDREIKSITPGSVENYVSKLSAKSFALKTVRNHLLVLNLIFKYAVIQGHILSNPAQYIRAPKNLPKTIRELPSDEQLDLVKQNYNLPGGMIPYMILYTGCRRGELIALKYEDIDWDNKKIHIKKSAYHEGNKASIKGTKSAAGMREIPLLDVLAEKLKKGKPSDLIFPGKDGMMSLSEFRGVWNQYCKTIGEYEEHIYTDHESHSHAKIVPRITPHQLRHGYATILFEAGVNEKDAQELLGHTSIQMTRDVYTHIRKRRKEETTQKLNEFTKNAQ
ncbi:tyrosine-type recombinase/integrase [Anaerotruncus rubiinfantis]|uniref:tyrosine-type recombinase/integrase n=1 Tax=Anaerotruncus rubiinfantis TaxID=1720200 RepID=UPI0034A32EB9